MEIFGSEGRFTFSHAGKVETYMGEFKVKCVLAPIDFIDMDKLYRNLLGDNLIYAEEHARQLAFAFSQLHFRVIEAPEWFRGTRVSGDSVKDEEVLFELLTRCLEIEEKYKEQKQKEQEEMHKKLAESIKKNQIKRKDEEIPPPDEPV